MHKSGILVECLVKNPYNGKVQFGFVGLRAEYRQDGKSTLEACFHKCFGRIGCIVRQQNMSMKRSGMRMGAASSL